MFWMPAFAGMTGGYNISDHITRKIKALAERKRQLTNMRAAEKNRTEHCRDEFIGKSIRAVISTIETQIGETEEQIRNLIDSSPELKQKAGIIRIVPEDRRKHRFCPGCRTARTRQNQQERNRIPDRCGSRQP